MMRWLKCGYMLAVAAFLVGGVSPGKANAEDPPRKRIVFVAGRPSHGYGSHEHNAGCLLLAKSIQEGMPGYEVAVQHNGWPDDPSFFDGADAVVMYSDGGDGHPVIPHLSEVDALAKKGVGIVCIHYAVEVPKGEPGDRFLDWIGGYFETFWSVNPHWTAKFEQLPDHPITRGVQPFEIEDEWYYHMRFRENMDGVTPILTAIPPESTLERPDGPHSGNPHVRAEKGKPQHVAWAAERPDGGRGFGFTGGHFHWNWGDPNFRKIMLNAIVWVAKGEVPENGVEDRQVSLKELEANQDFERPADFDRESVRQRLKLPADAPAKDDSGQSTNVRDPLQAVAGLDVAAGLEATLFASEPDLLSLTNLDIDARGRVWVCEVVNYRRHNGTRAEGDRILILEDINGDGRADTTKVFYQGRDIDSAMGICVLGNQVIVSASPHVFVFTDENGDDIPDRKEVMFANTGDPQHDHSAHSFLFGPDGKLYWNFGNTGKHVCDKDGRPIVDLAGNEVIANGKPYWGGMPFRCNLDGSQFEVLAHNFRNNYEVTVDSFGNLWQSDNDDDGNRGVRINFLLEYGNYGYLDEFTGASWQTPRTNLEAEIPLQHWHLNDPGVVPNLLPTGAGSPTGITVYEGRLLPEVFWDQVIHCDAGPNIVRSYPVQKKGAGYEAQVVNVLHGARDDWFRPADVCVAPDGSLFVTDWYDPGVGGHNMQDLDRGRLFRVAPPGHDYRIPRHDLDSVEGAISALKSPNLATRYLAFTALHKLGAQAEAALVDVLQHDDNPRIRARALWVLGKMNNRGAHYAELALRDSTAEIRIVGLRLARQLQLNVPAVVHKLLAAESDRQVLRECAIALRHQSGKQAAAAWAELAARHDGQDRWYLEALGIGADRQWDQFLSAWLQRVGDQWIDTAAGRDIVWRSRAAHTPQLLAQIIAQGSGNSGPLARYFRAFDFQVGPAKTTALVELAFATKFENADDRRLAQAESLARLNPSDLSNDAATQRTLVAALSKMDRDEQFVALVKRFQVESLYDELLKVALTRADDSLGVQSVQTLLDLDRTPAMRQVLQGEDQETALQMARALQVAADDRGQSLLKEVMLDENKNLELRRRAAIAVGQTVNGARSLIAMAENDSLDQYLKDAVAATLHASAVDEVRQAAEKLFPLPISKDNAPLPPLQQLVNMTGDVQRGKVLFTTTALCANCHQVDGSGKEVGPALTEIGNKLSRQALIESILFPSAGISHNYETYAVETSSGNVVTGVLVNKTDEEIVIKTEDAIVRKFPSEEVEDFQKLSVSLMPADLQKQLSAQDLIDVVEYLTTLKGAAAQN